jgi:hypothetical protein
MPRQWDIVEVPGEVWPSEGGEDKFYAVVVSSSVASAQANVFWVCPIRNMEGLRREPGFVPIAQEVPRGMFGMRRQGQGAPKELDPERFAKPMVRMDLLMTVTRHEMRATNFGHVDVRTQREMKKMFRLFAGI